MRRPPLIVFAGVAVAAIVAFVLSPFASSAPDGLERVAVDHAFADHASEVAPATAVLPDYAVSGVTSEGWSTAFAGLVGTFATFAIGAVVGLALARRKSGS